MENIG